MMRTFCRVAPLFALLLSAWTVMGQVATSVYPYGTYDTPGIDTINVGNLNVHLSIPVLHKVGRGLPFNANLTFDSSVYYPSTVNGSTVWIPRANFGWNLNTGIVSGRVTYYTNTIDETYWEPSGQGGIDVQVNCYYYQYIAWTFVDSSGASHLFNGASTQQFYYQDYYPEGWTCPDDSYSTTSGAATDGSGYKLNVSNYTTTSVTAPNGTSVLTSGGSSTTTDTNGNEISNDGHGHYTDTTGKVVLTVTGSAPNPQIYTYYDTSGNPQTVTVNYSPQTVQTNFGCSGIGEFGPTQEYLVSSIVFADTSAYSFSYDGAGRLLTIELPQGGLINYTYTGGNNGIECTDGSTAGLTRQIASSNGSDASTLAYTRTITGASTSNTTVVDGLGNNKVYTFVEPSSAPSAAQYYETSRTIYEGGQNGTPYIARNTCYNGSSSPCTTTAVSLPINTIDTYNTNNGIETDGSRVAYSSSGMPTETRIYDFGSSGSRGGLLRREDWTYGSYFPGYSTQDYVYDGSGSVAGLTIKAYDGTNPITSSGVPQHVTPTGQRENLTSVVHYASFSTSYTTSMTYEDTGSLLTSTTPNGTTTLSYDPSFVYLTGTQLPTPSSGVSLNYSATYDTTNSSPYNGTGLPKTTTDANNQVTSVSSYDSMLRPTEIDFPDGGKTILTYSPTDLSQHRYQSSSVYSDSETLYDAYGRVSRVAVADGANGSAPWYVQDICYDANGNERFVSYPYSASNLTGSKICSGAGDAYTYDVLGRISGITRSDGESGSYTYIGRATKSVDENNVTRISQVDGMGRLTVVCEISSNGSMPGSGNPTSCGTDIAGTGFTTTYSYALATGTTTVTQGGQTRTFQNDWLGRPTSIQEPESGTTSYTYSYNGTGLVVTRTKPEANQTNPSVLTTTTTQYDSLGRVVSIGYSDGTPTKTFTYDKSIGWGPTQTNVKGRLSLASVSNAQSTYSYDPMGRVLAMGECTPSTCGTTDYVTSYSYDWLGNLVTSADGSGATETYAYSPVSELQSITSSWNDSTHPPNLISGVQNGPSGPLAWQLGNGLTGVRTYDALGRVNGGWVCSGSTSPYCSGGTQIYGFTTGWKGGQLQSSCDTAQNKCANYGYDEFNRLASQNVTSGTVQNFNWVYDRWGNRLQQNVTAGSGPAPQYSVNTANNQILGFSYDAAGNQISDGFHNYTYDAEGNIVKVDGGSTATYTYDALNHRVRVDKPGSSEEFILNPAGQHTSSRDVIHGWEWTGWIYWGARPVAFYANGTASFEHQDWLGTERLRTTYNGGVEGTYQSLPWGDGQSFSGSDQDAHHYATLDYDSESNTDHAQFRQYSSTEGRFLSPDPYGGSYNPANPQSFNRYEYAMDNPLSNIDPSGLDQCTWYDETGGCNGPYSFWFQMQVGAGGGATTIIMNDGACLMDESLCQMAYQNMFENNQLQFPVVSSGGGGGGGGGGAPNNGSNAKQVWACRADAAINYGLGFIPGYNAAKLAFTIAGGNVNFVQNYISGKSIVTFDNPFTGMGNVKGMFWGANALASTYNTIMQAAKTVGPGAVLDDVAKAAGTAGTVANLVNTASAINDVIACGSVHN